jgi:hypothetical protein
MLTSLIVSMPEWLVLSVIHETVLRSCDVFAVYSANRSRWYHTFMLFISTINDAIISRNTVHRL